MSGIAKILDYNALVNLRTTLQQFSENIIPPLDDIERELNDILQMMRDKVDVLRKEMERAKERLDRAVAALNRCESFQRYDEDDHCYHPSCELEKAAERLARSKYEDAYKRYETADRIYKEVDYEVSQYLKPFGLIQMGGAAAYLRSDTSDLKKADDKMASILDIVEQILGSKMSPEGTDTPQYDVRSQLNQEAKDKKDKFIDGTKEVAARIGEQDNDDVYGIDINDDGIRQKAINEFNSNKCPYCGRPKKVCICERGSRER